MERWGVYSIELYDEKLEDLLTLAFMSRVKIGKMLVLTLLLRAEICGVPQEKGEI